MATEMTLCCRTLGLRYTHRGHVPPRKHRYIFEEKGTGIRLFLEVVATWETTGRDGIVGVDVQPAGYSLPTGWDLDTQLGSDRKEEILLALGWQEIQEAY